MSEFIDGNEPLEKARDAIRCGADRTDWAIAMSITEWCVVSRCLVFARSEAEMGDGDLASIIDKAHMTIQREIGTALQEKGPSIFFGGDQG